ncbi:HD-GYP domain-containing protein [Salidesulfovibrio onnuriiensis]|uniref:HD-GYP domain-containing protein n=1 Tax=Salidesulfovibrio onnuriiensis TaxID=2583823 RepID=UPI001650CEF2|nr:HD domain-containing phosphohydrolase [Salidesulfovibrio onnuriiensis]
MAKDTPTRHLDDDELPEQLNIEEFNQVDPGPLECFPKRALPLDLFHYKEEINVLVPLYKAGRELKATERKEFRELSRRGRLFFSRNQQKEYVECLEGNLEVAMDDPNLSAGDVAHIFAEALVLQQEELYANPKADLMELLFSGLELLSVFLGVDRNNARHLVENVHRNRTRQRLHSNAAFMALALYIRVNDNRVVVDSMPFTALAFFLYDIGMNKISRLVSDKPGQLSPDEMRRMKEHPRWGMDIIDRLGLHRSDVKEPALQHHERVDGSGYPTGLRGVEIGDLGRVMAVADSYVSMITDRPDLPGKDPVEAAAELVGRDKAFDTKVCRILVQYLQEIRC